MEQIMGCNEKVLLAIAETAALSQWKTEHQGRLNILELARRASKIEESLRFFGPVYNGARFEESGDDAQSRHTIRLVSNVFRAAARLYFHTVVSGCNPGVPEIKQAVEETVAAFRSLQAGAVDRSLAFPTALAGCLTDDQGHRTYLEQRVRGLGKQGEAVGNSRRSACFLAAGRAFFMD